MEKFSPIGEGDIIGNIDESLKAEIKAHYDDEFANQSFLGMAEKEKEKSCDELQIIDIVNEETNRILGKYGCKGFNMPYGNVHIIKKENWPKGASDCYSPDYQSVFIYEKPAKIVFANAFEHEVLHWKARNRVHIPLAKGKNVENVTSFSVGLSVSSRSDKTLYYNDLYEAINEQILINESRELYKNEIFKDEIEQTERLKIKLLHEGTINNEEAEDIFYIGYDEDGEPDIWRFGKKEERQILNLLIDKIFENKDKLNESEKSEFDLTTRQGIFDIFAQVALDGDNRRVVKLVDHIFGLGKIQEYNRLKDGDFTGQLEFVRNL